MNKIETIKHMKENGVFQNYIEYIVFPYYKNLVPGTKLNLEFPLTVLVGKNGSGKSSTLHALYGAPNRMSCSDFWFSTEVDPIKETGTEERNRFFYGYIDRKNTPVKEIMKSRIKRGSKTKEENPDYWETTRPSKTDGMKEVNRQKPVEKKVLYLNFRSEVSAFDKVFHFSKEPLDDRKELLRQRSKYLKRLFDGEPMRFPGTQDAQIGCVCSLKKETVEKIGTILGKDYEDIKVAEHRLYRNPGISIYVKTKHFAGYSEANAGSGETAVIQLVRQLEEAKDDTLVLLDEPEVSLHPAAQQKLKEYLLDQIKTKRFQIVISTHSPVLVEELPIEAIKLYKTTENGKFEVRENISYQEAFFDLEERSADKTIIFCEDFAAQKIIENVLDRVKKGQYFDVRFVPGGEKTLIAHYLPTFILHEAFENSVYFILDGDMQTDYVFNEDALTVNQLNDPKYLEQCVKSAFGADIKTYVDGGATGGRVDQKIQTYIKYLNFYERNVFYLPDKSIPERIILDSEYAKKFWPSIISAQEITNDNAKEVIQQISKADYGNEDHCNDVIERLAFQWSQESNNNGKELEYTLNQIFSKHAMPVLI